MDTSFFSHLTHIYDGLSLYDIIFLRYKGASYHDKKDKHHWFIVSVTFRPSSMPN